MTATRIDVLLRQLSNPDQCLFVADCVDHVLPTFTAVYPQHEELVHKSVRVMRKYARGETWRPDVLTIRHYIIDLQIELSNQRNPIAAKVFSAWRNDPRQRKDPTPTKEESDSMPRSMQWLNSKVDDIKSAGRVAAWWHADPDVRHTYAQGADAYSVLQSVLNLAGYEPTDTSKLKNALTNSAKHKAEVAAMALLDTPPPRFIHQYGLNRGHGIGAPDHEAVMMRQKMNVARAQATAVEQEWQREKLAEYL